MVNKPRAKKYARDAILVIFLSAYIIFQLHKGIVARDLIQIALSAIGMMIVAAGSVLSVRDWIKKRRANERGGHVDNADREQGEEHTP